jgi:hypothetical protein
VADQRRGSAVGGDDRRVDALRRVSAGTEDRLAEFTELVATTIANAQARKELSTLAAAEVLRDRASIAWVAVALAAEQIADGAGR